MQTRRLPDLQTRRQDSEFCRLVRLNFQPFAQNGYKSYKMGLEGLRNSYFTSLFAAPYLGLLINFASCVFSGFSLEDFYTVTELSHYNLSVAFVYFGFEVISDQFSDNRWILPYSGYKYTTENLCQVECLVILTKYMRLHKSNSQSQSQQLMRPICGGLKPWSCL